MRNGNISLGMIFAWFAGAVWGNLDFNESILYIVLSAVCSLLLFFFANARVREAVKDELEKAELRRKAAQVRK
jgi:hypothetical protein